MYAEKITMAARSRMCHLKVTEGQEEMLRDDLEEECQDWPVNCVEEEEGN